MAQKTQPTQFRLSNSQRYMLRSLGNGEMTEGIRALMKAIALLEQAKEHAPEKLADEIDKLIGSTLTECPSRFCYRTESGAFDGWKSGRKD